MANTYPVVIREIVSHNEADYRFGYKASAAVNNGVLVALDAPLAGHRDVWTVKASITVATDELWIVTGVELMYEAGKTLGDYTNAAAKPFRIERIKAGGTYAVSVDGIADSASIAVGDGITAATTGKLGVAGENATVLGTVVDVYTRGGIKFAAIRFTPAA